jgi:tRNA(Ile)-lysidine synthase
MARCGWASSRNVTIDTERVSRLAERVLEIIRRHELLHGGEAVLVAVSGGADSVALLDVLCEVRSLLDLRLACVHVNHGLRPEAGADADFVEHLAARYDVPFHLERVSVRRTPPWEGLEAEARRARYQAIEARAAAIDATRVAIGHTADDQAETVLMRLLGGAGPRGLAGIASRRGVFIRPLLETRRDEILAHLDARRLQWVEDASNRDPRFLRNRIRHDVMPMLADIFGSDVVRSLCHSATLTRALVTDLERQAQSELQRVATRGPCGIVFPAAELERLPAELGAEVLLAAAAEQGESRARRAAAHRAIRGLLTGTGRFRPVRLGPLSVERSGASLRVGPTALMPIASRRFRVPGRLVLGEVGVTLEARCFERDAEFVAPRERERVAFDADRLPDILDVRGRRTGDRFIPFGDTRERRLKSFLIDARIPRWERPRVPVLEAEGEIIWIAGVRRGHAAAVRADTKRILEVTLQPL